MTTSTVPLHRDHVEPHHLRTPVRAAATARIVIGLLAGGLSVTFLFLVADIVGRLS